MKNNYHKKSRVSKRLKIFIDEDIIDYSEVVLTFQNIVYD